MTNLVIYLLMYLFIPIGLGRSLFLFVDVKLWFLVQGVLGTLIYTTSPDTSVVLTQV